jgi:hypothetical protein
LHTIVIGPADEFGGVTNGFGKNGDAKLGDIELLHAM